MEILQVDLKTTEVQRVVNNDSYLRKMWRIQMDSALAALFHWHSGFFWLPNSQLALDLVLLNVMSEADHSLLIFIVSLHGKLDMLSECGCFLRERVRLKC